MNKPKLSCPHQEKINNRRFNHPCKNCKWFNRPAFKEIGTVRFSCDYPDGAFLQYPDGSYCFRTNFVPFLDIKEGD